MTNAVGLWRSLQTTLKDRKKACGGCVLRITIGIAMLALLLAGGGAATITVNASGGADYTKIQDAINNASGGDTIEVQSGIYYENVNVSKSVTLIGAGADVTIVNAFNPNDHVFNVTANYVNISGFTATGAMNNNIILPSGIYLLGANNVDISGNIVSSNFCGIQLLSSSNNNIKNNSANKNNSYLICLYSSSNNNINSNIANDISVGYYISDSNNNNITNNSAINTSVGFWLFLINNNTFIGNKANNNSDNFLLVYSSYNTIIDNNFMNSLYGISLTSSNNNVLMGNNIINSNSYGIYIAGSNNTIYNNNFYNSNYLEPYGSYGTYFDNIWNSTQTPITNIIGGLQRGGNFWGKTDGSGFSQTCTDSDKDGICDSPYVLDINNTDYLPLAASNVLPTVRFINGTVMDSITKEVLAGVTVSTTVASTTSNLSGFYSLPVSSGTYPITATYDIRYYTNSSVTVSTELSAVVVQDIELIKKPTGNITGSVTKA